MITALLHRRRLLFWLIRAYIKKRKPTILIFFIAGLFAAFFGSLALPLLQPLIPAKTQTIGTVGSYTIETLPLEIQNKISLGLTRYAENGEASPSASLSFEAENNGKTYTFVLRDDLFWQDGKKFTAEDINYNFKDVETHINSEREITFSLKEPFAPFPGVVSQPLFRKGLIGLMGGGSLSDFGEYKVIDIKLNGPFVTTLTIEGITQETNAKQLMYKFYPNDEVAKTAFMLGEVDRLMNLLDASDFDVGKWKNVEISKTPSRDQLVVLFYNTSFPLFADKNARQALSFALPRDFQDGIAANSPLNRTSWAYVSQTKFSYNVEAAKKLLADSKEATRSSALNITLTSTPPFAQLANRIKKTWEDIGVETTVEIVQTIPSDPQVLLERIKIPADPDQYVLWHSTQETNISRFANPKIDKLLEDGRQTTNAEERSQIYAEFQRHIVDESPAAFLFYPNVYTIVRK